MIKVCHVSTAHWATDNRIFHKECVTLASFGYDVTLIARGESGIKSGVKIVSFPNLSRAKRLLHGRYIALKLALETDADIYHLHDPDLLLIARKLKKKRKKVIFDSHEDYFQQIQHKTYIPQIISLFVANMFHLYQKYVSKYLDGFIFPSKENQLDVNIDITVVGNSPKLIKQEDLKLKPFKERDQAICYIGGLSYSRGITHLIKAAYEANCRLILVGSFENASYQNECQNMVEYSIVDYRGVLPHEEALQLLSEPRIGMATLLNVGQYKNLTNFATKITEYCMYGLPVIMNETEYHKKMLEKYNFGFCVNPENIKQITNLIVSIIDNPELLEEMGKNGRNLVENCYNWETESKNLVSLYSRIC
jgi:glycosyltransferase involved in cell wall biosynthesis